MNNIIINEYFKNEYLTPGQTYDNFVFENCSIEFLFEAKQLLEQSTNNNCKSHIIELTNLEEQLIEQTLKKCKSNFQKNIISRDYICSLIMREILSKIPNTEDEIAELNRLISSIKSGDLNSSIDFHAISPMPYEITEIIKKNGNTELNFFLINNQNPFLQSAINNFLSARTPYSIKVFTNNTQLPSSTDQAGNLIQSPHDFMRRNINDYITIIDSSKEK